MYQSNILKTAFENAEGVWLKDSNFAHPVLLEAEGESRKWELGWWEGARITESCKGWWPQSGLGAAPVLIWKMQSGWC